MAQDSILIISNSQDPHVDFVLPEIERRGLHYIRYHPDEFPEKQSLNVSIDKEKNYGSFRIGEKGYCSNAVYSVWYRRPLKPSPRPDFTESVRDFCITESEAAIKNFNSTLDDRVWMSPPDKIEMARNKTKQLRVASRIGLNIPRTLISNDPERIKDFYQACKTGMVLKTIRGQWVENSTGEGQVILTTKLAEKDLKNIETVRHSPSMFQEYIDKKFEVRATVIGNECLSAAIYSQENELTKVDWKRSAYDIRYEPYKLPEDVEHKCVRLVKELGLSFGGIDLICTPKNEWYFVEINPNGQWGWVEEKTGLPIKKTLVDFLAPPKKLRE